MVMLRHAYLAAQGPSSIGRSSAPLTVSLGKQQRYSSVHSMSCGKL
jgi:hypothetical protein